VILTSTSTVIEKRATSEAGRERLAHEAVMLRRAAHPGVVHLLGTDDADPPTVLRLRRVGCGDLAAFGPMEVEAVAGLGAALSTTVADLHDLGITHGAIEPAHVLLDEDHRPLLCSFGRTRSGRGDGAAARRQADIRALATLLVDRLPATASSNVRRVLEGAKKGRRPASARRLAWQLMEAVPDACLPGARPGTSSFSPATMARLTRRHRVALPVVIGLATCLTVGWCALPVAHAGGPARCPSADATCRSQALSHGLLTMPGGRYQLTGADEIAVMGRWGCGPVALPAVLYVTTGEVWVFDRWATEGQAATGRLVGRFVGARDLGVIPGRGGCDRLEVWWTHHGIAVSTHGPK
jgi:hypothetical protein